MVPIVSHEFYPNQRLARSILLTVLVAFVAVQTINVLSPPANARGLKIVVGFAAVGVLFTLQVFNSSPAATQWPMSRRVVMLVAQALVTYLPLPFVGGEWGGMAGWLAGSILLLVSGWTAWALFAAVVLSILLGSVLTGQDAFYTAYTTLATLDVGLIVFGLSRLALVIKYLNATRTELAQLAIVRERVRFAKDLHDLLGYSLSSIVLKAELTKRLVVSDPGRSCEELTELLDVARQALADVRLVAEGYRRLSLSKEAATVLSLLSAAGIRTRVEIDCGPLHEDVDTVLATVLREAVTNMLRHSAPQNCSVEAHAACETVRLRVINDGAPTAGTCGRDGGGLDNLASRLQAVGGRLDVNRCHDRFEVLATVAAPPGGQDQLA